MAKARRFLAPLIMRLTDWAEADRVARSLDDRIREIVAVPLLDGALFEDIDATTAGTDIVHGFDRTPRGAFVVRADTAATYVFDDFNKVSFTVTSSAASTISLWVF